LPPSPSFPKPKAESLSRLHSLPFTSTRGKKVLPNLPLRIQVVTSCATCLLSLDIRSVLLSRPLFSLLYRRFVGFDPMTKANFSSEEAPPGGSVRRFMSRRIYFFPLRPNIISVLFSVLQRELSLVFRRNSLALIRPSPSLPDSACRF